MITFIAFVMGAIVGFACCGNAFEIIKASKKRDAMKASASLVALMLNLFLFVGISILYNSIGS